ncbi:MAG TPA: alcohol dehydrogenase catalytic domain-containing protein [Candidatus Dormibacteraeota bacterium]|jgi:alcohol dehydrogenase|nr:alcohol dehydrogenase catalytic domain-containing protein [Candidatus Dormibacteraeota bacterium]
MRALTFVGRRHVEWRDVPDPRLQSATDAIVRPVAATTCDVDLVILLGRSPLQPPFALGHECVAEVVEAGEAITHVAAGDLVVVPWHISCGQCDRCAAGLQAHCRAVAELAMFGAPLGGDWGGLFSDLVHVPFADAMLVPLPTGLDPVALASAGDNWSLAWGMVARQLQARPGGSVLIMSRGSIGLYACDIAGALGASRRLYVDPDAGRRAIAESYGAEVTASTEPLRHGFDLAVEATGRVADLATACRSLVPEGVCESAGNHFRRGELPLLEMYMSGLTLHLGRDSTRAHIPEALRLAAGGAVHPRRVVSDVLDWEMLPTVLPELRRKPVFVRGPVDPGDPTR